MEHLNSQPIGLFMVMNNKLQPVTYETNSKATVALYNLQKFKAANSNNNFNLSTDMNTLVFCFDIGLLLFKNTSYSGISSIDNNKLNICDSLFNRITQIFFINYLSFNLSIIGLIVSILQNIDISNSNIFNTENNTKYTDNPKIHSVGIMSKDSCSIDNAYLKLIINPPESLFYDNVFISKNFINNTANSISKSLKLINSITYSDQSAAITHIVCNSFETTVILTVNLYNSHLLTITKYLQQRIIKLKGKKVDYIIFIRKRTICVTHVINDGLKIAISLCNVKKYQALMAELYNLIPTQPIDSKLHLYYNKLTETNINNYNRNLSFKRSMTSSMFNNNICVINKMVINNKLFNGRQYIYHDSVSNTSRGSSDIITYTIAATLTIIGFNDYENGTEIETSDGELTLEEFRAGMKETIRFGDDKINRIFKELD